eukprot:TRINITY_DN30232_c0_g1_i2.p1 TRINITY_DN30232_c0_g1~~TRINITY_DN30232_c0_g1_i2.p1  ORF type:complete len:241 (+),score=38.55 TRINITY_DN30232_c0_g1_i2:141-863(+)
MGGCECKAQPCKQRERVEIEPPSRRGAPPVSVAGAGPDAAGAGRSRSKPGGLQRPGDQDFPHLLCHATRLGVVEGNSASGKPSDDRGGHGRAATAAPLAVPARGASKARGEAPETPLLEDASTGRAASKSRRRRGSPCNDASSAGMTPVASVQTRSGEERGRSKSGARERQKLAGPPGRLRRQSTPAPDELAAAARAAKGKCSALPSFHMPAPTLPPAIPRKSTPWSLETDGSSLSSWGS